MEQIISKEELDELMKLEGEVKGGGIKNHAEFILKEEGEEGLKKLEDEMAKLGHLIKYRKLKTMEFYPFWLGAATLLVIKRLFNYNDQKFQEMGGFQAKSSFILRFLMKYFFSIERAKKVLEQVPALWRKYNTRGDLKVMVFDIEKKYGIVRIENYPVHPLHCHLFLGLFSTISQMVVKSKTTSKETKCTFRGDEYHEFLIEW